MAKSMNFNVALCDSLQLEYCKYKHGEEFDRYLINRILRYSEGAIITNVDQLKRIGREDVLKLQEKMLRSAGLKGQKDVAELASRTAYSIVLSDSCNEYPYVNIIDPEEPVQPVIGGCFFRNQSRDKAVRHIASLCGRASEILIYDWHLSSPDGCERNMRLLASLLPDRNVQLVHHPDHLTEEAVSNLCNLRPKLMLRQEQLPTHHDRYIVIDGKMEIILTSGFYYLDSPVKEITYVVRHCAASRFS
ncbi:MAG: hypothetical protein K1V86_02165 [Duncaniella sp.]|jgi:hypothetical protein